MLGSTPLLFSELRDPLPSYTTGILPSQTIEELIAAGYLTANPAVAPEQIQPSSLDLRLGAVAYRVRASFLSSRNARVIDKLDEFHLYKLDLTKPTVLERGCAYIVPLMEELNLPADISGKANPKSTTGRLDVFTRLISDYGVEFDRVPPGYKGKLYAEIVSRTFTVGIRAGMRLSQLRFVRGNPDTRDSVIKKLDRAETLVYMDEDSPVKALLDRGLRITINLEAIEKGEVIAYKAKRNAPVIELDKVNHYSPEEFWELHYQSASKGLILQPGDFYILASRERVRVPPDYAAEMVPFDPSDGEFRIHYAGFFDSGFGYGSSANKRTPPGVGGRGPQSAFLFS